ncbi:MULTISPECIES: peptidase inhibitor family I36 protein [Streptomyces]|uniref:peptidase inhibitor family I36 protein n=1 Tax=Streptomyces TaxID=1883 RepID=UPI002DD8B5E0|nr:MULTISPECIES: peptidase inhibitor family I36 protein [Streptomyces]WST82963.1 peptidase inhibitor family I36 protein [Streptomyces anulatus]WRZ76502.1 peptidase inhibitor family I36 protein [Streptomyces sp. NBC_01237]WSU87148.1 peptidase inhibitor family I36 protein [Streptomyces anulatus]WSU94299.1 peptidase inhibitor family I36 protein [Streptomyces anulatus]WTL25690.1 peptidase inhibitor family I36 protein [Streptomyces sp. NBC_01498]
MRRFSLLTAVLSLGVSLAVVSPAQAVDPVGTFSGSACPANKACLYRDSNFTGGGVYLSRWSEISELWRYGFNDQMSSWSNDTGVPCFWWKNGVGSGTHVMDPGYRVNVLSSEDNHASSAACYN